MDTTPQDDMQVNVRTRSHTAPPAATSAPSAAPGGMDVMESSVDIDLILDERDEGTSVRCSPGTTAYDDVSAAVGYGMDESTLSTRFPAIKSYHTVIMPGRRLHAHTTE